MYVIAGLGNMGSQYERTRHNAGFDALDFLAAKYGIVNFKPKHKSLIGEGVIQGEKVMLVKPQTYMNNSGEALSEILSYYKVPVTCLVVLYDDIDLEVGKIRIRPSGSAGTHNGMRSIIYHLRQDDFPRVRIGIGKPPAYMDLASYVLGRYTEEERPLVNDAVERAAMAAAALMCGPMDAVMNKYNR